MNDSEPKKFNLDERLKILTLNLHSLTISLEQLSASTRVLLAAVEAQIVRDRERHERERRYLTAIADVLKHWANGEPTEEQ